MAKKIKTGTVVAAGAGLAAIAAYAAGVLPFGLQGAIDSLANPGRAAAQPIQGLGPTTQPPVNGCNTDFIPGVRYVARSGTSGYVVVIGGQVVYQSPSQNDAEQRYNALVCGR